MKKQTKIILFAIALAIGLVSFITDKDISKREFNVKMTGEQVQMYMGTIDYVKQAIQSSTEPANKVSQAIKNLDSLERYVITQVNIQIKDTSKTIKKDSIKVITKSASKTKVKNN